MGKKNVLGLIIITLTNYFGFSSDIFINHCLANKPKPKEKPIRKTIIKIPLQKSISLVIKNKWSSHFVPEKRSIITNVKLFTFIHK